MEFPDNKKYQPGLKTGCGKERFKLLFSKNSLFLWGLLLIITLIHYISPIHMHWIHDLMRRAYYLPIVIAAMRTGLWGGVFFTGIVTIVYFPHAFTMVHHIDPANQLEKILEIVLYFGVAAVAGYLSNKEYMRSIELNAALEEQKILTDQLVRAGRLAALGEVVAGISHEIKNPLHSLAGTAEVVDPEIAKDSKVRRMWEIHKSEIERLKRISERFLSFARPTSPAMKLIDLNNAAARLMDLTGADARQKNITIKNKISNKPIMVKGDLDQIAQVGLNIILNAFKVLETSGDTILINTGVEKMPQGNMAFLSIENNGAPIKPSTREKIFNPFHSGNDGTGLGLSISSRIIQQHNGFIDVKDKTDGACFKIYLKQA